MPEENRNQKKSKKALPLATLILAGDEGEDTQTAKKLLDEAGISYRFAHADISEGPLPQLFGGCTIYYVGLYEIARVANYCKQRHFLANSA